MESENEKAAEAYAEERTTHADGIFTSEERYTLRKHAFLAGWNERDKRPITLTNKLVDKLFSAAVNAPYDAKMATFKKRFEAVLNGK